MSDTPNITCVKCTSVLDRATFEGLEVDLCPGCGGLWLDRGEITRAARLPQGELDRLRALVSESGGPPPLPTANISPCPVCPGALSEVVLGNVHVDYCGSCHGLFLDKGELEDAIRAVKARDGRATGSMVIAAAVSAAGS
jgi:Zn-finger nucleic acid-binding protein